jgi:SAM-dependent methyltransferase
MHPIVNSEQAEAWNGYEGAHWADHADRWNAVVGGVNDDLLAAAAIDDRSRVLDVGCGTGQTTRLAARRAPQGYAVGIDLSAPMLAQARTTAAAEGIGNVRFHEGDAQVFPFPPGEFDVAISRGGILFFTDPVAAFANIARALRPGGRVAFACLREMDDNPWFVVPASALLGHRPSVPDPHAPGMFSLSDPARIEEVFTGAGFEKVATAPLDTSMVYGRDAADAAGFYLSTGPVRHHLTGADAGTVHHTREAVTTALRPYEEEDAVRLPGAWWLVTATRP